MEQSTDENKTICNKKSEAIAKLNYNNCDFCLKSHKNYKLQATLNQQDVIEKLQLIASISLYSHELHIY